MNGTLNRVLHRIDLRDQEGPLGVHLPRPDLAAQAPTSAVREIISEVREGGDSSIRQLTNRFDDVDIALPLVPESELEQAWKSLGSELTDALQFAHNRILYFHEQEAGQSHEVMQDDIKVTSVPQPVERAGLYVPGGLAAYPSTVLMTALPAKAAGVKELLLCTPPDPSGDVDQVVLAAAHLCGVREVYKIGGAQAVAAMAYGSETIRPVDVIAGPGNIWVATAKQEVAGTVGIAAAFAGPSEIVDVGDET